MSVWLHSAVQCSAMVFISMISVAVWVCTNHSSPRVHMYCSVQYIPAWERDTWLCTVKIEQFKVTVWVSKIRFVTKNYAENINQEKAIKIRVFVLKVANRRSYCSPLLCSWQKLILAWCHWFESFHKKHYMLHLLQYVFNCVYKVPFVIFRAKTR